MVCACGFLCCCVQGCLSSDLFVVVVCVCLCCSVRLRGVGDHGGCVQCVFVVVEARCVYCVFCDVCGFWCDVTFSSSTNYDNVVCVSLCCGCV